MISVRASVKVMAASDAGKQKRVRKENDRRRSSVYRQLREISKDLTKLSKDLDTLPQKDVEKLQEIFADIFDDFYM